MSESTDVGNDGVEGLSTSKAKPEPGRVRNLKEMAERKIASYLRNLSLSDAQVLEKLMLQEGNISVKPQVESLDAARLPTLRRMSTDNTRDGAWYLKIVSCRVWDTKQQGSDHPRWQVKLAELGSGTRAARIRKVLSKEAWETLTKDFPTTFKPMVHHIVYNADPRRETTPLPLNGGAGGSTSHLCDVRGCLAHLEASPVHRNNMDRQRCSGITLLCHKGFILQEWPCAHGERGAASQSLEAMILGSCRKVRLLDLDESAVLAVKASSC